MSPPALSDAEVAIEAARAGAAVARARFGGDLRRTVDRGVDVTTDVDIAAERAIRAVLEAHRTDDAVIGEELGVSGEAPRRWLVDPICGTLNFAAGVSLFAVNVALDIDGRTSVAAVADPPAREILWSDGERAWSRTDGSGDTVGGDRPIVPSPESRLVSVNLLAALRAMR